MKVISNARQATLRTFFILISIPTMAFAGVTIDESLDIDTNFIIKIALIFIASFWGGVSSALIPTSFDSNMPNPKFTKIWIGTALGSLSGWGLLSHFNLGLFAATLPSFVIGSLGAPIMVFYLMWFSSAEAQAELREVIKQKVREKIGSK